MGPRSHSAMNLEKSFFSKLRKGYKNLIRLSVPLLNLSLNPPSLPLKNTQDNNGQSELSSPPQDLHPMLINLFHILSGQRRNQRVCLPRVFFSLTSLIHFHFILISVSVSPPASRSRFFPFPYITPKVVSVVSSSGMLLRLEIFRSSLSTSGYLLALVFRSVELTF